ncbi:MAG: transporter substrate-binding domain-containing protein [Phycicoccus sp.]|nr:transporter substrate-binding domain-containing protein [Phycicoccus sp.]
MSSARSRRARLLVAAVALSSLALAACGSSDSSSDSTAAATNASGVTLLKDGKLLVCTHLSYKPFQYKDEAGKVVGFDVDLMDLVAKKLGVEQEIVDIDFAQITSGAVFAAKKCDTGAAATTITDERKNAILFSDAYFSATQALLVKKDSGIKDLAGLKDKKIGVQTDTTGQIYAEDNMATNGYTVTVFDDMPTQLAGVLAGRVDGAINDNGVVYDYAKDNPTTEVVTEFHTGEEYGFMFQKDNENATALATLVNQVLTDAKADGSYNDIYKKWFGVDAPK